MTLLDPRITPARADLAAEFLKGKVEASRFAQGREMRVSASMLDLRSTTDPTGPLSSQLLHGEGFIVYETRADGLAWGQSVRDGYVGFLLKAGLSEPAEEANAQVNAPLTHIYTKPDMKTKVVNRLPFLSGVHSKGTENGFAVLGTDCYCPEQHLSPLSPLSPDPVEIAERFLGYPYLWGGRSVLGIDCSGLIQVSLQALGEAPPRDSDMLASLGEEIAENAALQRGDLIHWKGHVGVMQDAETLLHANAHAMAVTAEPLKDVISRIEANGFGGVTARRRY